MSNTNTVQAEQYYYWDDKKSKQSYNDFYSPKKQMIGKEFIWQQNNDSKIKTLLESWSRQLEQQKNNCCCCPLSILLVLLIGGYIYMAYRVSPPTKVQFQHICVHDQFIQNFSPNFDQPVKQSPIQATLDHEKQVRREGKPGNWIPIRIKVDYNNLKGKIKNDLLDIISLKLIPPVISFLQTAYSVYPQGDLKITRCHDKIKITENYSIGVQDVDLQIFATVAQSQGNWVASAAPCFFSDITGRPIAGVLQFNLKYLKTLNGEVEFQKWIQTLIHEFTHILGFSNSLFHTYVNPNDNQRSGLRRVVATKNEKDFIILPLLQQLVQQYFNCGQAFGALLENAGGEGSAGSHWERSTFGNEAMTASLIDNPSYSIFTLTLMESTGWYLPNYGKAQPFSWGRNAGCEITVGQCFKAQQCGNAKYESCNFDYSGIGRCKSDQFSYPCKYWMAESKNLCTQQEYNQLNSIIGGETGFNSRCFESTLANSVWIENLKAICLKAYCEANKPIFYIGGKQYLCDYPGKQVNVEHNNLYGTITCPNQYFCEQSRSCKNNCSGAGTCRQTICDCWNGYYGDDCSQKI